MSNGNFTVMIAGIAKSGMEDYVKKFLKQLMEHSRKDKGCILYNIHQSTPTTSWITSKLSASLATKKLVMNAAITNSSLTRIFNIRYFQ
jgi:hypothetical protein